ncbi:MAG: efflux RND transporter periplasmic adaptor subunit [Gammaproteobacteria bacterium]|nr:efflux RND transporter periplasmic adaptor subunit [Gammaproteobacteria bacterium]
MPTLLFSIASHSVAAAPIPVHVQPFAELAIYPPLSAPATVVSDNHSRLSAELQARIVDIPVQVGDRVEKGALLVRLDGRDFELIQQQEAAALAAVEARLGLADYELQRARALSEQQAVSEQLLKQREAERDALLAERQGRQAAVAQARQQLDKTEIRAPFAALIMERIAQLGELAHPGTALLRIMDTQNLELAARLSPAQTADLAYNEPREEQRHRAPVFVSAGQRYPVSLRRIVPALDTQARTQEARLRFTAQPPLPGAAGRLVWSPIQAHLPAELISQRQGRLGVLVQAGDTARFVPIEGAEIGRPAVAGLEPETAVITEGRYRLNDGDAISVLDTGSAVLP